MRIEGPANVELAGHWVSCKGRKLVLQAAANTSSTVATACRGGAVAVGGREQKRLFSLETLKITKPRGRARSRTSSIVHLGRRKRPFSLQVQ
eukprot:scaffold359217_cov35-Prasinocladus_malaysianus.AAC.1